MAQALYYDGIEEIKLKINIKSEQLETLEAKNYNKL